MLPSDNLHAHAYTMIDKYDLDIHVAGTYTLHVQTLYYFNECNQMQFN